MSYDLRGLFQIGVDVLTTTINKSTKKILAQVGHVVGEITDSDNVEWWQHYGFVSRPPKPKKGKAAAQAFVVRRGDHDCAIASQDLRGLELYGELDHGEVGVYCAGDDGEGQGRALFKKDGAIHLYTRVGNKKDGAGMTVQVNPQDNSIRLINGKGYGLVISENGVELTSGDAVLELKKNGDCSLIGKGKTQVDGSGVVIGSDPTMLPGKNSAVVGPNGLAAIASAKVLIET